MKSVAFRKRGKRQTLVEFVLELDEVRNGEVDAMVVDSPIASFALRRFPKDDLAMVEVGGSESPAGIALSIGEPVFLNIVKSYRANVDPVRGVARAR